MVPVSSVIGICPAKADKAFVSVVERKSRLLLPSGRLESEPAFDAIIEAAACAQTFLPDFIWIRPANRGIEPTKPRFFFDDCLHLLLRVVLSAGLSAVAFGCIGQECA